MLTRLLSEYYLQENPNLTLGQASCPVTKTLPDGKEIKCGVNYQTERDGVQIGRGECINDVVRRKLSSNARNLSPKYNLIGAECGNCDTLSYPAGRKCPKDNCQEQVNIARDLRELSGYGEIFSHTTIISAPNGYESMAPYTLAQIKLKEGPLTTAQLTDYGGKDLEIGDEVEMVLRKLGVDGEGQPIYGPRFRPPIKLKKRIKKDHS